MAALPLLFLEKNFPSFIANAWFLVRNFSFVKHAVLVVFPGYSFVSTKVFFISCFLNSLSSKIIMVTIKLHPTQMAPLNAIWKEWNLKKMTHDKYSTQNRQSVPSKNDSLCEKMPQGY